MRKGTTLIWLGPGNAEAGWGFNPSYNVITGYDMYSQPIYQRMPPSEANSLPDAAIRSDSFFNHFDDEALYDDSGSDFLLAGEADVRNSPLYRRLLADAIPALSNPAGRNDLGNAVFDNTDLMELKRGIYDEGNWPRDKDEWRHSDMVNVAFPYNHALFEKIILNGDLK
jgi:hypothetical protein